MTDAAAPDPAAENVGAGAPAREPSSAPAAGARLVFDDPLDRPAAEDRDHAWGDRPVADAADLARFLDDKPPHHL